MANSIPQTVERVAGESPMKDAPRCKGTTITGRRCVLLVWDSESELCRLHLVKLNQSRRRLRATDTNDSPHPADLVVELPSVQFDWSDMDAETGEPDPFDQPYVNMVALCGAPITSNGARKTCKKPAVEGEDHCKWHSRHMVQTA